MDRREATDILVGVIATNSEEENEALDLAIEALGDAESATTTDCNDCIWNTCNYNKIDWDLEVSEDCISREQVIKTVHKYFVDEINKSPYEIDEDGDEVYTDMKAVNELFKHNKHISKAIKALPPVNQKQITGKLESAENATSEGEESTTSQPKSKLYIPLNQYTVERINRLHKNDCGDYFDEEWLYNELEQIAEILQSVTPTERTGEWERFSFPDGDVMECTNCGYRDWADVWEEESRNYCPNCGAKMGGEGND